MCVRPARCSEPHGPKVLKTCVPRCELAYLTHDTDRYQDSRSDLTLQPQWHSEEKSPGLALPLASGPPYVSPSFD